MKNKKIIDALAFMLNSPEDYHEATEKKLAEQELHHAPKLAEAYHNMNMAILNRHDLLSVMLQQINSGVLTEKTLISLNSGLVALEELQLQGKLESTKADADLIRDLFKALRLKKIDLDNKIRLDRHDMNIRLKAKREIHELERRLRQVDSGEKP